MMDVNVDPLLTSVQTQWLMSPDKNKGEKESKADKSFAFLPSDDDDDFLNEGDHHRAARLISAPKPQLVQSAARRRAFVPRRRRRRSRKSIGNENADPRREEKDDEARARPTIKERADDDDDDHVEGGKKRRRSPCAWDGRTFSKRPKVGEKKTTTTTKRTTVSKKTTTTTTSLEKRIMLKKVSKKIQMGVSKPSAGNDGPAVVGEESRKVEEPKSDVGKKGANETGEKMAAEPMGEMAPEAAATVAAAAGNSSKTTKNKKVTPLKSETASINTPTAPLKKNARKVTPATRTTAKTPTLGKKVKVSLQKLFTGTPSKMTALKLGRDGSKEDHNYAICDPDFFPPVVSESPISNKDGAVAVASVDTGGIVDNADHHGNDDNNNNNNDKNSVIFVSPMPGVFTILERPNDSGKVDLPAFLRFPQLTVSDASESSDFPASPGQTPSKPKKTASERPCPNKKEKQRRIELKEKLEKLKILLPDFEPDGKVPQNLVLERALSEVQALRARESALLKEKARMRETQEQLVKRIEWLKRDRLEYLGD